MLIHLLVFLLCSTLSYGAYLLAAMFLSSEMRTTREAGLRGMIEGFVMWIVVGGTTSFLSLALATGAVAFLCRLGWRYRASPLGQFIARLPGLRSILYLHHKYWLPSRVLLRPQPRFFYLKRLIIRQSDFIMIFP